MAGAAGDLAISTEGCDVRMIVVGDRVAALLRTRWRICDVVPAAAARRTGRTMVFGAAGLVTNTWPARTICCGRCALITCCTT